MAKKHDSTEPEKPAAPKKAAPKAAKTESKKETAAPKAFSSTKAGEEKAAVKPKAAAKPKAASKKTSVYVVEVPVLKAVEVYSRFTDFDISLFKSGKHYKLYEKMGSHVIEKDGVIGTYIADWAPNA